MLMTPTEIHFCVNSKQKLHLELRDECITVSTTPVLYYQGFYHICTHGDKHHWMNLQSSKKLGHNNVFVFLPRDLETCVKPSDAHVIHILTVAKIKSMCFVI